MNLGNLGSWGGSWDLGVKDLGVKLIDKAHLIQQTFIHKGASPRTYWDDRKINC